MKMNRNFVKIGLAVTLAGLTFFFFQSEANAFTVGVDKPRVEITAPAGATESGSIEVRNKGDVNIMVDVTVEDFIYDETGERHFKQGGSTPFSCADWIEILPMSAEVPANGTRNFNYNIKIPEDAIGGRYAVVFFNAAGLEAADEFKHMGVKLVGRIGSVIYVETEGKTNKIGSISDFKISKPTENRPLVVDYKFKNEGNAFIRFKGILSILDKAGNPYGTAESETQKGTLPGDIRDDEIKWFGSLPKGEYDLILTVDIGKGAIPLIKQESVTIEKDI